VSLFGADHAVPEVLAQTEDFLVVLDVAPVTPGHALVVTRAHERSFAAFWRNAPQRVDAVAQAVVTTLQRATGRSAVVCEHGLGPNAVGHAGCVEHAHMHVIPADTPLLPAFRQAGVDLCEVSDLRQSLDCAIDQQYLYLLDTDSRRYAAVHARFPSQLVRRLVAQKRGDLYWSWRDYVDFAAHVGTKQRIIEGRNMYQHLAAYPVFTR